MTANGIYSTTALIGLVRAYDEQPKTWLLDTLFPRTMTFTEEAVAIDEVSKDRHVAAFVSPMVAGRPLQRPGAMTTLFKPAYVKPKTQLDPNRPLKRMAGEAINGSMTPEQRAAAILAEDLIDHEWQIKRREEWMAAHAVLYGKFTVSGEDYPEQLVDFGRHADNTIVLTGSAKWDTATHKPLSDIRSAAKLVRTKGRRASNIVIMNSNTYDPFYDSENVKDALDRDKGQSESMRLSAAGYDAIEYQGTIRGQSYFTYDETITDPDTGDEVFHIPDGDVVVASTSGLDGVRAYGSILDVTSLKSMPRFAKTWIEDDPSALWSMTQSAPLIIPANTNATVRMKVY